MVADPSIRYYARSLTISRCSGYYHDKHVSKSEIARSLWKACWDDVLAIMSPMERICFDKWYDLALEDYGDAYMNVSLGALLTLLPNLEVLP